MAYSRYRPGWLTVAAVVLFIVLFAELFFSVRQNSQTFDEAAHLYAGYSYWKHGDFGINPEHPPLAKMVATVPLLPFRLDVQPPSPIFFRRAGFIDGRTFLYSHDAERLLLRARLGMSVFTFALGLLILLAAREMFGDVAAAIALLLFVFEPNILANGALVTTDIAVSATLFATIYAFYRYTKSSTPARLLLCALAAGLVLCVKHSGLIVFPLLLLLALGTLLLPRPISDEVRAPLRRREMLRLAVALLVIGAIAYTMLWSAYGFRYAARPGNAPLVPATSAFLAMLHQPLEAHAIAFAERHHLLPEAYLYGMSDIAMQTYGGRSAYLLGKLYPKGPWFYFPFTFFIKSTLGFLLLLVLALTAAHLWRKERARELLFLLLPTSLYFTIAMFSHLDIGHRHVLPIYPFIIVFIAAGAAVLLRRSRTWATVVVVLMVMHAVSSLRAFPAYLPYSNELWGGPSRTWKVLADSNVGWSSGLKPLQQYIQQHGIQSCWLAQDGPVDLSYFRLPCKRLPTAFSLASGVPQLPVPIHISGPIFIASEPISGFEFGPAEINPYRGFSQIKPDDEIQGQILVYNGSYSAPGIAGLSHLVASRRAAADGHADLALAEAQQAAALAPELLPTHEVLINLYLANHQLDEARREYAVAMQLYNTVYSAYVAEPPPAPSASPQPGS